MAKGPTNRPRPRTRRPRDQRAAGRASFPEIYFLKQIDNSRLRREVDPSRRAECFCYLGLGIVVFLFVLLFAWQHFQGVRYGYQIEQLKAERSGLEEWNRQLRLDQASLANPHRIDALARRKLGLSPPGPQQVIPLGGVTGGAAEAGPAEFARNFSAVGREAIPVQ